MSETEAAVAPGRVTWQLVAGTASSAIAVLAAFVAMPLYLRFLGAEAFGVLGFIFALQAAVLALDAGLAVSVTRSVAQAEDAEGLCEVASLARGLSHVSWAMGLVIAAVIAAGSPWLAHRWLNLGDLPASQAMHALMLAGAAIGLRWPIALYQGVLIGRQRLVALGALNVAITLLSAVGAVAVAARASDLRWVMAWLTAAALVHILGARWLAFSTIGVAPPASRRVITRFLRRSAAAGWLGLIGLLLMQLDKLVLSRLLPVAEFGYYTIASLMAASLYAIVSPLFNVIYPRLAHKAMGNRAGFEHFYRSTSLMQGALVFPLAAALGIFGEAILLLWTGDEAVARTGGPVVLLLAFGTVLHGTMFLPYALKLALGATRLALGIGLAVLLASVPVIVVAAWNWGPTGAAAGWLGLHAAYLVAGSAVTHGRLLPTLGARWLVRDVGMPLLVSLLIPGVVGAVAARAELPAYQQVGLALLSVVACWVVLAAVSARLRQALREVLATRPE